MPRVPLFPRNPQFFALLDRASENLVEAADALHAMLAGFPEAGSLAERIHELERAGDEVTHDIVRLLDTTFVTPLDREDIHSLASSLDDVADHVDEAADDVVLYGVQRIPPVAVAQADLIRRACRYLQAAVGKLDGLHDVRSLLVEVHTLENEGDRLERAALGELFSDGQDALVVIRWKDIHEQLELALDACERVADVLERAYLKHR